MTEITFETIAEEYNIPEDEVEKLFMYYDTNDFKLFKMQLAYLLLLLNQREGVDFETDLFKYISQCTK